MRRVIWILFASFLVCDALAGEVRGATLTSSAFPVGTISIDAKYRYVGRDKFILYGVARCELHVWVDATPDRQVRRLYWVQFEQYLQDNNHTYDYSDQPWLVNVGGHEFWGGASLLDLEQEKVKWRPGSDYEHVLRLLEEHGYRLAAEVLELALFRLDPTARKELMIIYIEDVRAQGREPADLVDRKTGNVRYDAAAKLRERGLSGLRAKMR